jgi:transcriptional regulator with XRE-family HTH domain
VVNQEKSGKYIAEKRKQLGMTQKDLAEQIGLTDKAVSKWERGKSIPDSMILDEICRILQINFAEYISGEDIEEEHYSDKAEENIKELISEKHSDRKYTFLIVGGMLLSLFLVILGMYGILMFPGGSIGQFVDIPSFVLLVGIVLLGIIISGYIADFIRAFEMLLKKKTFMDEQIDRSYDALRVTILLNVVVGIFLSLGQIILYLGGAEDVIEQMKSIPLALLSLWYGILLDLILLPFLSRLHTLRS